MTELPTGELIPPITEDVDLKNAIIRIPTHQNPNLPRPGIPDFSDETTYTLLVNLARELDDPKTHGLEKELMTPREAKLLRVPDISNIQYPIVSIPKLSS